MNNNRQKYLSLHPYEIYFSETEQRWRTQIPDTTKKSGRRDIKRKNKVDIENFIVEYYKNKMGVQNRFSTLYYDWLLNYKKLEVSNATLERIHSAYTRHYENSSLANTDITLITPLMLKTFLLGIISRENLNYKAYSNIATIPRQLFDYCMEKQLVTENPMDKVKIKKSSFRHDKKPDAKTQVFMEGEKELLEKYILDEFRNNPHQETTGLAILLAFQTGIRVGELVTLKFSDIKGNYLTVERTETSYSLINPDGTKTKPIYEIKDFPKSADGNRDIPLTDKALKTIEEIKKANASHGYASSEYIFINWNGKRINRKKLDTAIRKYCRCTGLDERSSHKIRKTFISTLIDTNGISKDEIRRIAGHSDLSVTNSCYVFNRNPESQTLSALNKAL